MGVLGGVFVLKSGLRILIRAPEVPFSVPPKKPKTPKMTHVVFKIRNPLPQWGGTVKNHPVYCFWSCFNPSRFLNMYSCIPPCHNNPSFQPAIPSINLVAGVYGRNCHLQRQNFYFYKKGMIFSLKQKLEN